MWYDRKGAACHSATQPGIKVFSSLQLLYSVIGAETCAVHIYTSDMWFILKKVFLPQGIVLVLLKASMCLLKCVHYATHTTNETQKPLVNRNYATALQENFMWFSSLYWTSIMETEWQTLSAHSKKVLDLITNHLGHFYVDFTCSCTSVSLINPKCTTPAHDRFKKIGAALRSPTSTDRLPWGPGWCIGQMQTTIKCTKQTQTGF